MLIANINSSGSATVNVDIGNVELAASGTMWLYGQSQTTPLETPMPAGLGNAFSVNVPARSIVALLIDAARTLDGDYNEDGQVDAADYIVWRKGMVDPQADYATWRLNFGNSSGAGVHGSVPEPTTLLACAIGMMFTIAGQRALRCSKYSADSTI
jgi:hypothetical protein